MKSERNRIRNHHELLEESATKLRRSLDLLKVPQPSDFLPGQMWHTKKEYWTPKGTQHLSESHLVLILKGIEDSADPSEPDVEAALILPEGWMATDKDLLLPESHPLLSGSMITFWKTGPILARNLERYLGKLERGILDQCEKVWQYADGLPVEEINTLLIGTPIFSTADSRYGYQREILEETRFLWEPAMSVAALAEERKTEELQEHPVLRESSGQEIVEIILEKLIGFIDHALGLKPLIADVVTGYATQTKSLDDLLREKRQVTLFNRETPWGLFATLSYLRNELRLEFGGKSSKETTSLTIRYFERGRHFTGEPLQSHEFTSDAMKEDKAIRYILLERKLVEDLKEHDAEIIIHYSGGEHIVHIKQSA